MEMPVPAELLQPRRWAEPPDRVRNVAGTANFPPPPGTSLVTFVLMQSMGRSHPVTWSHDFEGGRAWYTAMGHTTCSYSEGPFLDHILGGILYAAKESLP